MPLGIGILDLQGHMTSANEVLRHELGYSHEELAGSAFGAFIHPDDRQDYLDRFTQLVEGQADLFVLDERLIRRDGGTLWVVLTVSSVWHADGSPGHVISVTQEFTERKLFEGVGSRTTDASGAAALAAEFGAFVSRGGRGRGQPTQPRRGYRRGGEQRRRPSTRGASHRQIAVLAGPTNLLTARERTSGFRRALADAGMNNVQMVHGPFTWDGGNGAAKAVVAGSSRVTCMLAVNDVMAMGALAALRDASISVPQWISVAGLMTCRRCATPRPR